MLFRVYKVEYLVKAESLAEAETLFKEGKVDWESEDSEYLSTDRQQVDRIESV